jgi:hypothetical protein
MSGHKVASITISQDEYRRLYELEKSLQYQTEAVVQSLSVPEIERLENNLLMDVRSRQDSFLAMVSSIRQDLLAVESRNSDRIMDQERRILTSIVNQSREDLNKQQSLMQNTSNLVEAFTQKVSDLERNVESMSQRFDDLVARNLGRHDGLGDSIVNTIDYALELIAHLEAKYPGHLLDGHDFESIRENLEIAEENYHNGYVEASLSASQTSMIGVQAIHRKIQIAYFRYVTLFGEMVLQFNQLSKYFDDHANFNPIDAEGIILEEGLPLDQWSKGEYGEIADEINQLAQEIGSYEYKIPEGEIIHLIEFVLPGIYQKFSECLTNARLDVLSSQRRFEIANRIILGLIEQGYKPVRGEYKAHSYLNGYFAEVENGSSKINIIIDPVEHSHSENVVHVMSLDFQQMTKHELEQRAIEIKRSLADPTFEVAPFKEAESHYQYENRRQPTRFLTKNLNQR